MIQIDVDTTEHLKVFEFATAKQLVNQALEKSKLVNNQTNKIKGIPSGFIEFDKITNGFQKTDLSTFAIKKGMGKTAFLLSLINNIAVKNNFSLGVFSPERSSDKCIHRIIESETGTSIEKLNTTTYSEQKIYQLGNIINRINNSKIFIDDTPILQLKAIYQKVSILKNVHNIDIIIIDGFNKLTNNVPESSDNNEQFNKTILFFKSLSQEFEIPIILFYQIEKPYNEIFLYKKFSESDLPDFINKLSDNVYLIDRTDLHYRKDESIPQNDYCELLITKQKNEVNPQSIKLKFLQSIDKFIDYI